MRRITAVVAVLSLAATTWVWFRVPPQPYAADAVARSLDREALAQPGESVVALARDGSFAVFPGPGRSMPGATTLFAASTGDGTATALFEPSPDIEPHTPFISPDGQWVGFISGGQLMKVPSSGGSPVGICHCNATSTGGGAWLEDGSIVFQAGDRLRLVAADGRHRRDLTRPSGLGGERTHGSPAALAGGNLLLYTVLTGDPLSSSVMLLDMKTGRSRLVRRGARFGRWVEPDVLVYLGADARLHATHLDDAFGPVGPDVVVEAGPVHATSGLGSFDVANDGTLVFAAGDAVGRGRSLWWVARDGTEQSAEVPRRNYTFPRISPDGRMVALDTWDSTIDVWLWQLADNSMRQLTEGGRNGYPTWIPDGSGLLIASDRDGIPAVYRLRLDAPGDVQAVATGRGPSIPYAVSQDQTRAVIRETRRQRTVLVTAVLGQIGPVARITTDRDARNAALSPDGRWLAYQAGDAARSGSTCSPFPVRPPPAFAYLPVEARCRCGDRAGLNSSSSTPLMS